MTRNDDVVVTVENTGVGIYDATAARIFDLL
jgi:hypothetical protein